MNLPQQSAEKPKSSKAGARIRWVRLALTAVGFIGISAGMGYLIQLWLNTFNIPVNAPLWVGLLVVFGILLVAGTVAYAFFLKALSYVRNRGTRLERYSTAVFDFLHQYRPAENVVRRAVGKKGRGFYFIGHHEIMVPLLAAALGTGQ